jgi:branched-chain amino acid transport system ATP-binding protein
MIAENDILQVKEITQSFGGVKALNKISLQVQKGDIYGVIGPNGAGKTTLFNIISGLLKPDSGEIYFKSNQITNLSAEKINKKGLARTYQQGSITGDMTVLENVMTGMYYFKDQNPIKSFVLNHFSITRQEKEMEEKAREILNFVGLKGYAKRWSNNLVWVERQLVQLAMRLVAEPDLLLLDELAAGMGQEETSQIKDIILKINDMGTTVMLISHNVELVMELCDKLSVINFGEKISEGSPADVKNNPDVLEAYIGE